jgi:hypothetical protein
MDGKNGQLLDRNTCRSICEGIGERLQDTLRAESLVPSTRIEHLMDLLRKLDACSELHLQPG